MILISSLVSAFAIAMLRSCLAFGNGRAVLWSFQTMYRSMVVVLKLFVPIAMVFFNECSLHKGQNKMFFSLSKDSQFPYDLSLSCRTGTDFVLDLLLLDYMDL